MFRLLRFARILPTPALGVTCSLVPSWGSPASPLWCAGPEQSTSKPTQVQQSLLCFAIQGARAEETRAQRLARLTSADAVRSGRAQALGLTWPAPSVKRSVGKPSRQKRWTERLYRAIVRDEHVPPGLTAVVPPWWFGGSLLQPDDPVDLVQAASQELQPEEVLPEAPDPPPLLGNNPLHQKLALAKARAIYEC